MKITAEEKKDLEEIRSRLKLADQLGNTEVYTKGYTQTAWRRRHAALTKAAALHLQRRIARNRRNLDAELLARITSRIILREAELLGEIRRKISQTLEISIEYKTTDEIIDRYEELRRIKAEKDGTC